MADLENMLKKDLVKYARELEEKIKDSVEVAIDASEKGEDLPLEAVSSYIDNNSKVHFVQLKYSPVTKEAVVVNDRPMLPHFAAFEGKKATVNYTRNQYFKGEGNE